MRNIKRCVLFFIASAATCAATAASPQYTFTTLFSFNGANGALPTDGLFIDSIGNLYGTTALGGDLTLNGGNGSGTVFTITAGTHSLTTLATFNGTNGRIIHGPLIADAIGNLYGTTANGGAFDDGTVFKLDANTHTISTLVTFNQSNGESPYAGLIADSIGNLYGTTESGGAEGHGSVFKVDANTHSVTTLASFTGPNGALPEGALFADTNGNLYGTTIAGGANNKGTVFELDANTHALTTLVTFNGTNGAAPSGSLIADASGNLFGTTGGGGANNKGTVFEIAVVTHALSTLVTFNGTNGDFPDSSLIFDGSGNLFGMTDIGGANNKGTVFEVAAGTHALSTLVTFNGTNGTHPFGTLVADINGNLYGITDGGGTNDKGTVFELSPVPEPSSLVLGLLAVGGLPLFAWMRAKSIGRRSAAISQRLGHLPRIESQPFGAANLAATSGASDNRQNGRL